MSSFLAIGAVTALLKNLLEEGLIRRELSDKLGGEPGVDAVAPDLIQVIAKNKPMLNLFLYQATPNSGWRNVGLPSHNGQGERTSAPPLALDLHYLLTAYSKDTFGAEILLGYAMQLLHETPVLTRQTIRQKQQEWSSDNNNSLLNTLAAANLADQAEQIKISQQSLDPEAISRLWMGFKADFRPTVAYQVTVVLIESDLAGKSPLPVLTRGPADSGVVSQADLIPPFPTLTAVVPPNQQASAQLADALTLHGHHLDGGNITVRFNDPRSQRVLEASPLSGNAADRITVRLRDAQDPAAPPNTPPQRSWAAGLYSVAALVQWPGEAFHRTANDLPFALAPTILMPVEVSSGGGGGGRGGDPPGNEDEITFTVECEPEIRPEQRAVLLVGDIEVPARPHPTQTDT
ncbi:MAG: DUF4255 domain-containing protein, partial [Gemmatimonadota bacterium]|nr:DUF4255 domain-containing protein [Gemmatimonadota bacterium]